MRNFSHISELIRIYGQAAPANTEQTDTTGNQPVDPNTIQPGQSVYDPQGAEFVVLDGTAEQKMLVPKDQQNNPQPTVQQIDPSALGSYTTTNPMDGDVVKSAGLFPEFRKCAEEVMGEFVGAAGFSEAWGRLGELVEKGYEAVDAVLVLGEEFPRELANKVLAEGRRKGLI